MGGWITGAVATGKGITGGMVGEGIRDREVRVTGENIPDREAGIARGHDLPRGDEAEVHHAAETEVEAGVPDEGAGVLGETGARDATAGVRRGILRLPLLLPIRRVDSPRRNRQLSRKSRPCTEPPPLQSSMKRKRRKTAVLEIQFYSDLSPGGLLLDFSLFVCRITLT